MNSASSSKNEFFFNNNLLNTMNGRYFFNRYEAEFAELADADYKFIKKLKQIIEEKHQNPLLHLSGIAELMFLSERQLQRKSKALLQMSPSDILREYRLKKATSSLVNGYQVSMIPGQCGFNSLSYFSNCFKKKYGLSPKQYQKQNMRRLLVSEGKLKYSA